MMLAKTTLFAFLGLLASVRSKMTLTSPPPITKQASDGPCGNLDPYDRTNVEEWPIRGHDVGVTFTENAAHVTLQATVINEGSIEDFRDLRPPIHVNKADDYCYMRIRGIQEWIGKDVLFQVKEYVPGQGYNFTCAAIKFVEGGPHKPTCRGFHEQLVEMVAHPPEKPLMEGADK